MKCYVKGFGGLIGLLTLGLWLIATPQGQAHAHLQSAVPSQDAVISDIPEKVVLIYTEPVEVRFSTFKVYVVEPQENALKTKAAASQLVSQVLRKRNDQDAEARVDRALAPARGLSDKIEIGLKDDLKAGTYVVMWHVFSVDTHTTEGFYVFEYAPDGSDDSG